jgi:4-hydroxy-2-oxoheptanedioate aldolase
MAAPINPMKAELASGAVMRGPFLALGSEAAAEIAGRAGFDYCLIDGEHAPFDPTAIRRQLLALDAVGMPAAVRVPTAADWVLKQVLDLGAQSVMIPMIDSAEAARAVVRACRFPPAGIRGLGGANMRAGGFGHFADYPGTADAQICVIVQIESAAAVSAIEEIAAVEGVDALFVGPADLGLDLGYGDDLQAAALWDEVARAVRRIVATGKPAGVFAGPAREAQMLDAGATLLGVGADTGVLTAAMRMLAEGRG